MIYVKKKKKVKKLNKIKSAAALFTYGHVVDDGLQIWEYTVTWVQGKKIKKMNVTNFFNTLLI